MEAFEQYMIKHENRLFRAALAMMGNKAEAEDVVQEVFLKVWEKRPVFQSMQHEAAWLMQVTVNCCRSRFRSAWWRRTVPMLDSYPAQSGEQQQLLELVAQLPVKYRIAIHLFYYEGYSTAEIAEMTGQKESTARSLLTRARRKLKHVLMEEEGQ